MKTDTQLRQDVLAELQWEPSINAAQIAVEVRDGIVTLTGNVGSYAEKWDAGRAVQRVSGVKALAIQIEVWLSGPHQRSDTDIARSANEVLQWTTYLPRNAVRITVENGWVTLSGEVTWEYQRQAAIKALRYLMGVTGVSDETSIKPKVTLSAVKADIEAALKRRATEDAQSILVEVVGADVTLTGTVNSLAERELARHSAWNTPGVQSVKDNMTVVHQEVA